MRIIVFTTLLGFGIGSLITFHKYFFWPINLTNRPTKKIDLLFSRKSLVLLS
jgi:hypothetical protein